MASTDLVNQINDLQIVNGSKTTVKPLPSTWTSHSFTTRISDTTYTFRVLKMNQSLFIYIGGGENETFDALAVAMPIEETISTTILGAQTGDDSKELAQQFTKRLNKQVFLSFNVPSNGTIRPLIVKRLSEEIKNVPNAFWAMQTLAIKRLRQTNDQAICDYRNVGRNAAAFFRIHLPVIIVNQAKSQHGIEEKAKVQGVNDSMTASAYFCVIDIGCCLAPYICIL